MVNDLGVLQKQEEVAPREKRHVDEHLGHPHPGKGGHQFGERRRKTDHPQQGDPSQNPPRDEETGIQAVAVRHQFIPQKTEAEKRSVAGKEGLKQQHHDRDEKRLEKAQRQQAHRRPETQTEKEARGGNEERERGPLRGDHHHQQGERAQKLHPGVDLHQGMAGVKAMCA